MNQPPFCSIIIRAYNEEQHIGRLLTGISAQTIKETQVILVDSGSTDSTVRIAQQFPIEVVTIKPEEFTFGRSLNLGITNAKAELVVMASAHVYPVYPDWLEKLLEPFKDSQVGLTYGKQRGCDTTQFSEQQIFQHWFPESSVFRQNTPFCNNANAAIRRNLWQEHAYDETLPALEDLAWSKWAQEKGVAVSYCADAEVIHVHNESLEGIFNRYRREGMAFKQIYPQETFTRRDLYRLFIQNILTDWREAKHQGRLRQEMQNIWRFRWRQFSGTYYGYEQSGPLTWQLKQSFYYPRQTAHVNENKKDRQVTPIHYQESTTDLKHNRSKG
ncbi:MAG: glycosyltransferase family 2 protein [Anaerolineaceae bacterium]